jgi:L-alanine-DL-glutamate epimerase-like enolase superfamily enzyme
MKVTALKTIVLSYPHPQGFTFADACGFFARRTTVLVQIETDAGISGIGESACFGGPPSSTVHMVEKELAPYVVGRDPMDVEQIMRNIYWGTRHHGRGGLPQSAASGIDIALWDIIGKKLKTPLYKLFGAYTDKLLPYASAGFYQDVQGPKELADDVAGYIDAGYKYAKIKCARTPEAFLSPTNYMPHSDYSTYTMEKDLERVEACCRAIEGRGRLIVDGNNGWTAPDAIKMGRVFEKLNVYFFEEPVSTDNLEGCAQVAAALDIPVAGFESETNMFRFRDMIAMKAVDIVQPDVIWAGGFTACRKIAAMAELYHIPVIPHAFSSAVCLAANMHLIASIANYHMLEVDQNINPLRTELLTEPIELVDGMVPLMDGPGLGIELNEDTVKKYQIFTDPS